MDKLLRNKKAIILFIAPAFLLFTFVLFVPICQHFLPISGRGETFLRMYIICPACCHQQR